MPRRSDTEGAFRAAIKLKPSGCRTVSTQYFVMQLVMVNWDWSLKEANE